MLCKYLYYPHIVRLTTEELEAYVELSERIAKYFNDDTCSFAKMDEGLKMLLLARKRIVYKAANKLKAFEDIIKKK